MGKKRRKSRKSTVPEWVRKVSVNERKRQFIFEVDIEGLAREAQADDSLVTFVIRPQKNAKEGPGPYDYIVEFKLGNIIIPAPLNVFFPDEKTHGREFFEKVKGMLREAGALKEKP